MPILLGKHEFLGNNPLQFKFALLKAENPNSWEGWLEYEIELYNGEELVTKLGKGATIIDSDVERFCDFLIDATGNFEPMEPDFKLVKFLNQYPGENNIELFITLDEGIRRGEGYAGNGLGISLLVSQKDLSEFTTTLKGQYHELIKDLQRT